MGRIFRREEREFVGLIMDWAGGLRGGLAVAG